MLQTAGIIGSVIGSIIALLIYRERVSGNTAVRVPRLTGGRGDVRKLAGRCHALVAFRRDLAVRRALLLEQIHPEAEAVLRSAGFEVDCESLARSTRTNSSSRVGDVLAARHPLQDARHAAGARRRAAA